MKMGKYCTKCFKRGEKKKLKPYLINFEEAVLFCINEECNNSDTFQVVGLQQLVFKSKSRRKKNAGTTLANKSSEIPNVGFPNGINTTENVVVNSVHKELDDILFGLTNINSDPSATLDNDDLEFFGFGDTNLTQPVEKTAEVVISENFEDLGLGHNLFFNVQTQKVEKPLNETFKINDLDFLRFENLPPSSDKVEKASKEVHQLNHIENVGLDEKVLSSIQTKPVEKTHKEVFKSDDPHFLTFNNTVLSKISNASVEKTCFRYPLWRNESNLCWLHAMMCVLVHNNSIRNYVFGCMRESFLNKLILGYDECVALLNSVGTNPELISETLKSLRDQLFTLLKPKMKRNLGECDNPWFVLWALVSREKTFGSLFDFKHRWETVCQCCGHKKVEKKRKSLQTFTKISDSFSLPNNPSTIVACVKCKKQKQTRCLKFEEFPSVLAFHFEQGFPLHSEIVSLDFKTEDAFYKVSAVIQYKRNPNHFVTWIRDISSEKLLCCDDLNSLHVSFKENNVDFKNDEVHIVFWDKTKPVSPKENIPTQCSSVTSSGVTQKTTRHSSPSPFWLCNPNTGSWVDEDISLKNWDCNSSSYSNHSNSTAPITDSRATTPNSLKSFASTNDSLATQPSQKRRKTAGHKSKKETGKDRESTQPRLRKWPTSSISDMSNPSDGDLSIVSVLESSKCEGYQGYRPKTLPIISPSKPRIINRSPKRPKYDKGKSKKCKSPKKISKKSNSSAINNESQQNESNSSESSTLDNKSSKRKESSFDATISNLLNDTNFFAL